MSWVGATGVEFLSEEDFHRFDREALGPFPRNSDGSVDWSQVPEEFVLEACWADEFAWSEVGSKWLDSATENIIFCWGGGRPSIRLSPDMLEQHLPAVVEGIQEFCIYAPEVGILVEKTPFAGVTVARIPAKDT
ncbi:hypothetical protein GCM10027456_77630 [Kineosporia babensis]